MKTSLFAISAVERDTGLAKETLRVWERRYGFPAPERDSNGERLYPIAQVDKLRLIKRLMDQGFRPGRLMSASDEELASIVTTPAPLKSGEIELQDGDSRLPQEIVALIKAHDDHALRMALHQAMHRQGLMRFVLDTVSRLNEEVGEAWMRGEFAVFEEHLYTEQMQSLLRQAISTLPAGSGQPRIVMTTLPDEQHILGLLMGEAILTLEGATCISLGTQTPLTDIAQAARAHQADIVALSFSAAFAPRQIGPLLRQLRSVLPAKTVLWAGGSGVSRVAPEAGVALIHDLPALLDQLSEWRQTKNSAKQVE